MYDDQIKAIARKYGITLVYLFGSEAERGRIYLEGGGVAPRPFSDLDVAVAFEKALPEPMETYGYLYREIAEIFVPFDVDLLFMQEVNTLFQHEIIRGIRIYARDEFDADEFEEGIMKWSEDLLFKKKILDREIMEAVENGYIEFEYSPNP
ncbi:MAG: nucleotidyltransferase domain-containing protein [Thermodesulfobacteriota bacterium]|nr:nucleotidyltransferase domain-containing protein [Thermodesulfobacteriota bacterium]